MTEEEWLKGSDLKRMLRFSRGEMSDRKHRLFCCECCRSIWHVMTDERSRRAAELAERHADDDVGEEEWLAVEFAADQAAQDAVTARQASDYTIPEMFIIAARAARFALFSDSGSRGNPADTSLATAAACWIVAMNPDSGLGGRDGVSARLASTLRELVGNPFRPVAVEPGWLTPDVVALASAIYDERAFDRMPILADALEEAGCGHADVLTHCRGDGPHVRGCWVVDLLLGKA